MEKPRNERKITPEEEFKQFTDRYKNLNWGYIGQDQQMMTPMGVITIRKFPSGATYIVKNNGTLEKMDKAWFARKEAEAKRRTEALDVAEDHASLMIVDDPIK